MKFKTLILFVAFLICALSVQSQQLDKLLSEFMSAKSNSVRIRSANGICKFLNANEALDSMPRYNAKSDTLQMKIFILASVADWFVGESRYTESIELALQSAKMSEASGNVEWAGNSYSTLCVAYQRIGDMEYAIANAKKCYEMDVKSGIKVNMSSSLNNLATLCLIDHKLKEAKVYIDRAILIERPLKRSEKLAIRLGTASEVYSALGLYDQAIALAKEAYQLDISGKREENSGKRLAQLASAYYNKGDLTTAKGIYLRALPILLKYDTKTSLTICYNQLGILEMKAGNNAASERYLLQAVQYAEATKNAVQLEKSYQMLSKVLEKTDPTRALVYLKKAFELQDKLFNEKSEAQIDVFNTRYKVHEQQDKIEDQKASLAGHRLLRNHLIGLLIILLIFIGFYIKLNGKLKRRNAELAQVNAIKDKFFSLISHDLRNPVTAQQKILKLILENDNKLSPEKIHSLCEELLASSTSLNELLFNLLNWSRMETGQMEIVPIIFNLKSLVIDLQKYMNLQLEEKNLTLNIDIPDDASAYGDINMISTVLRNLLSNAVKFSYNGSHIDLKACDDNEVWYVSVSDHGIGLKPESMDLLFKLNTNVSTTGTAGEKGTGLGLILSREMVERNGGKISADNLEDGGARFTITIKKHQ